MTTRFLDGLTAADISAGNLGNLRMPAGTIVKCVIELLTSELQTTTTIPNDNTNPQSSEGVEVGTKAYTPIDAANTIHIIALVSTCVLSGGAGFVTGAIFKDSGADAIGVGLGYVGTAGGATPVVVNASETAGSTSARTYKLRAGPSANTLNINRNAGGSLYGTLPAAVFLILEVSPP